MLKVNGWASMNGGTTGGKGGAIVSVNNRDDFRAATTGNTPKIVQVNGTIDIGYTIVGSNKTIVGIGMDAKTIGTIRLEGSKNIIIKNISCTNPGGDGIAAGGGSSNFFISHCSPNNCADGAIDVTKGSDFFTIEWCKFWYDVWGEHNLPNLIGADNADPDEGKLKGTIHHCYYWKYCVARMPRVRKAKGFHVYCNFFDPAVDGKVSCLVQAAIGSEVLVENNHFESGDDALEYAEDGKILARGNTYGSKYIGERVLGNATSITMPPYAYELNSPDVLGALVRDKAGVDGDSDLTEDDAPVLPFPPEPEPVEKLELMLDDDATVQLPKDVHSFTGIVAKLKEGTYDVKVTVTGVGETVDSTKKIMVLGEKVLPPSSSLVTGFRLINASTDTEGIDIVEGGSYSLAIHGSKLNMKALVTDASVSRVKFELSGVQNTLYIDKAQPFCLHGDNGKGDYYAGTWNPPPLGAYKLIATPIDAAGIELSPKEINFSFIK